MRHAAVTLVLGLVMRLFGASPELTIKTTTVAAIGGEIVQWHVGPCVRGAPPSPLCGKPERTDAFMGIAGGVVAVAFTLPGPKPHPVDVELDRIRRAIIANCDSVRKRLLAAPDSLYRQCRR